MLDMAQYNEQTEWRPVPSFYASCSGGWDDGGQMQGCTSRNRTTFRLF
jgi:hypothetical protein